MVKVTPAHDPNDFGIGQRHNLAQINIFDISATLNDNAPEATAGLTASMARKRVVEDLERAGLLVKIEDHIRTTSAPATVATR